MEADDTCTCNETYIYLQLARLTFSFYVIEKLVDYTYIEYETSPMNKTT